jgi:hypothetical protein
MPQLNTEQVTTHTLVLTDAELAALRNAARIALDDDARAAFDKKHSYPDWYGSPDPAAWQAFSRLGLSATRGSLSDQLANPKAAPVPPARTEPSAEDIAR